MKSDIILYTMMKTEEIRSVLIKLQGFPTSLLFGANCRPLFPQLRSNGIFTYYFLKSIVARSQTEKGRKIPKLTPLEHINLQFIFIEQLSIYF